MILSPYGKGRGDYRKGVRFDANPYTRQDRPRRLGTRLDGFTGVLG